VTWYDNALKSLETGKSYSHKALLSELKRINPSLSSNTYHWAISCMIQSGKIIKRGYDEYTLPDEKHLPLYLPAYSELTLNLIKKIEENYPYVEFTVFETTLMNDFLNHMISQNTIFLQIKKDSSIFVFRYLQEAGYQNIMYKPTKKDFELYWTKDSIIITDLITEAPLNTSAQHFIVLEKMLVDIYTDKLISTTFSKSELPNIFETAKTSYQLDKGKMLRYARRRNRIEEIKKLINTEDK